MPKINYQCEVCLKEHSQIYHSMDSVQHQVLCVYPPCTGTMVQSMSMPLPHSEFERGDDYRNKHALKGINKIMKERSRSYQKKYDLGEQIEKHGADTMSETTFFNKDGTVKTDLDDK